MTNPTESREVLAAAVQGRYAIRSELGRGGMATVYLADDLKHHRQVAVKVLRPDVASALGASRFLREIQVAAALSHPHILPLYDSGEITLGDHAGPPLLFYVMPYVRGESLRARLDRERRLPVDEALRIAGQVAAALQYAHSRDLIHRDIKPENILLHEGEAMVADFGIVRTTHAEDAPLTDIGIIVGTPAYMSPEQVVGESVLGPASDVYSLGCVLYEMLAGQPPFTGATSLAVMSKRLAELAPSVRRLRPEVPFAVDQAITTALARDPDERFRSAQAFGEALAAPAPPRTRERSVAVLPFVNMSADPENEYFADGITEDVIAHLSKVRDLEVISRTSVMPFRKRDVPLRDIAERLRVTTVLEGSVRRAGDKVRIVAQLIDPESDQTLWAETYDHQLTDIFATQTDVALKISAALNAKLSPAERKRIGREPTTNLRAYQMYLQGRYYYVKFTREAMRRSIDYFRKAAEIDPNYAMPHVGMALAFIELAETGGMPSGEAMAGARTAVTSALTIDSELGESYCTLGYLRFTADFDWTGAEEAFRRSLELSPGFADTYGFYGRMLASVGRYEEAVTMMARAHDLDPMVHRVDLATSLLRAGRFDEAIRSLSLLLELEPNDARGRATLGWAHLLQGRHTQGVAELERAAAAAPGDLSWFAQLGEAYGLAGDMERANEVLARLAEIARDGYVSPYHLAYVHTGLGNLDAAIDLLETAYEQRSGAIYGIKGSFVFIPLRGHPRFEALLRKMKLA